MRTVKPVKLFKTLEKAKIPVEKYKDGIYYVSKGFPFAIQIIVTNELNKRENVWLTALTGKLSLEDAERVVIEASRLSAKDDKEFADSVLQIVWAQNADIFNEATEVGEMFDALYDLMKPRLDAEIARLRKELELMQQHS